MDIQNTQPKINNDTVTIATGQTTSDGIDLQGMTLCGLYLPSAFDGSTISFQASETEDGTFVQVLDTDGSVLTLAGLSASKYVKVAPADFAGIRFLKLVAGAQTGATVLPLALRQV